MTFSPTGVTAADDAMAVQWVKAGRLGVDDDLAHDVTKI
jgi:hypothetical protein